MQGYRKFIHLFFATLIVFVASSMIAMRGQTQNNATPTNQGDSKKAAEDFYTITDYAAAEPTDPKKRALRHARGKRYGVPPAKGVDPKRFMISEERESSFGAPRFDVPPESALPASASDIVIIGEIVDAEAFLSEDKTGIYSEFTINVGEVLKNSSSAPVPSSSLIVAERDGGGVRFASGKVILAGNHAKPLPRIGRRYLFFLKQNPEEDFSIITGYELHGGRVSPLDGRSPNGGFFSQYAAHQTYVDADETTFLNKVREAIALCSNALEKGR
jgi:hypothetical protein